ncbi:MAG: ATP-dependent zinc protease family protein [Panacagrimonas sp.]
MLASCLSACGLKTLGWVEPVCVQGLNAVLMAKLDTGADRTSIDARGIEIFERDDQSFARFRVADEAGPELELPLAGEVRVRRQSDVPAERKTVRLTLSLAGQVVETEASLADRSGYDYPMLIGRDVLAGRFVVNSSHMQTTTAVCNSRR